VKPAGKSIAPVVFLTLGILLFHATASWSQENHPACQAASAPVDYGNSLKISEQTKSRIESYRSGWERLCDPNNRGKVSLSELFTAAKQIEDDFKKIFEAFDDAILKDSNFDPHRIDDLDNLVSKQFPKFVPAFHGAYGEHEYFSPSADEFQRNSSLGNDED